MTQPDPTLLELEDGQKVRRSDVQRWRDRGKLGAVAIGPLIPALLAVAKFWVEPYERQIDLGLAREQALHEEIEELKAEHAAAYNAMLCEWAFAKRCSGDLISTSVGGGVCKDMLEDEACPERL